MPSDSDRYSKWAFSADTVDYVYAFAERLSKGDPRLTEELATAALRTASAGMGWGLLPALEKMNRVR